MPAAELVRSILDAAEECQRELAGQQTRALIQEIRSGEQVDPEVAASTLEALRAKRWFDLLQPLADTLMQAGLGDRTIRKLYAQALLDQGTISAALAFLEKLEKDCPPGDLEHEEARGLLGRAYKQSYVDGQQFSPAVRETLLQKALEYYDRDEMWHRVNTMALRARAARDGIAGYAPVPELAEQILAKVSVPSRRAETRRWSYANAAEACVALGRWDDATRWIDRYLKDPFTDAFEVGSTLRQLTEVWQLETLAPEGATIIELLRAALLHHGGERVVAASIQSSPQGTAMLERVFGKDGYQTLEWYRQGLVCSRAVARLGFEKSKGVGTGFLIRERELDPNAGENEVVLLTNAHVLSETWTNALRWNEAVVTFESIDGHDKTYSISGIIWSSPPDQLDATVARLESAPADVTPVPIAKALPDRTSQERLFVIGYPLGGTMSFSINDNLMLDCEDPLVHYRSPTDPGSSGSPVFNHQWSLVALHHKGSGSIRKLNGQTGTYEANEGLYIGAIAKKYRERKPH